MTTTASDRPHTSAAASFWPAQPTVVNLRKLELGTFTCPQCARRPAEADVTLRTSGKLDQPGRLAALAAFATVFIFPLFGVFPILLSHSRNVRRGRELKVRLCTHCHARGKRTNLLERCAESVLEYGPIVAILGLIYGAGTRGSPPHMGLALLVCLALHALAVVGEVALVGARRRRLPFVLADAPGGWRVELPASWNTVLTREAPATVDEVRVSPQEV